MTEHLHKTVSYGRKTIAFGLPWFTTSEDEQPRKAASALIKKSPIPFDLSLVRKGEFPQFALACSSDGAKSGSISAASMVAEMAGMDSWLFVLEIGEDVWICAGREGFVLPDGDKVYEDVEEARRAFDSLSPTGFKKVYLPKSWQEDRADSAIEEIEGTDIRDFLSFEIPKWGKIQGMSSGSTLVKGVAALSVLGGVGFGAMAFLSDPEPVVVAPDPALVEQLMNGGGKASVEEDYARLDANQPWANEPTALAEARACLDGILSIPITPVGYDVTAVTCAGGQVDASVQRTTGYTSWLTEWAQGYPELSVYTDPTGSTGSFSKELPPLAARGMAPLTSSHTFEVIQEHLFEMGQIEGSGVTVGQPTVDVYSEYPDYIPAFATGTFTIKTKRPFVWLEFFGRWDGIAIDNISLNLGEQTYTMEGKLYVPNF